MEIRTAEPEDAGSLGRMHHASWREAYGSLLPEGFFSAEREAQRIDRWRRQLTAPFPGSVVMVAVRGQEVVGHASSGPARPNPTTGPPVRERELWSAYVLAGEYGTGLAHRLLEAVLPPGTPAELWVLEENPRARAFYAKHGFAPDGGRHVAGPEVGGLTEIRLVR